MRLLQVITFGIAAAYLLLLLLFYFNQRTLIYFPERRELAAAMMEAKALGLQPWNDSQGKLLGWKTVLPGDGATPARERWIVFHGNAGTALDRIDFVRGLQSAPGGTGHEVREVRLFEYPGYDARPGMPSETAIVDQAGACIEEAARDGVRLFLVGESLGGAVVTLAAARQPDKVAGLFLFTPLPGLAAVGQHHYPLIPVRLLLREPYAAQAAGREIKIPAAFVQASADEIIPPRLGAAFYADYPGPKRQWLIPGAQHNTIAMDEGQFWWREVTEFLAPVKP